MTRVLDVYLSIESGGSAATYECVSLSPGASDDVVRFATGDFLADWKAAMRESARLCEAAGADAVSFLFSSTIDFWHTDSCEWVMVEDDAAWPTWRRLSPLARARLRGDQWKVCMTPDLADYRMV